MKGIKGELGFFGNFGIFGRDGLFGFKGDRGKKYWYFSNLIKKLYLECCI